MSGGGVGCAPEVSFVVGLIGASPKIQFMSVCLRDRSGQGDDLQRVVYLYKIVVFSKDGTMCRHDVLIF